MKLDGETKGKKVRKNFLLSSQYFTEDIRMLVLMGRNYCSLFMGDPSFGGTSALLARDVS